jgi:oligopeptide transport system substrate-binding protein
VLRVLADPLVDYTPVGGQLRPAAAEGWQVALDGLSVVFTLRRGVQFHHGREVTAEDYLFSLSRVVRPETGSEIAYHLAVIDGYDEVRDGRATLLRGVRALGPYRLRIRLRTPFHDVAALFSHRLTAPVPRELCESDSESFRRQPVSNGPYRLIRPWDRKGDVALERFAGYHAANAAFPGGGAGHAERLDFVVHESSDVAYRAWTGGTLDVLEVPGSQTVDAVAPEKSYHRSSCAALTYLAYPVTIAPFDDPTVRRAIAMSINRERLCHQAGRGELRPANRLVPPQLVSDDRALLDIEYNPALARKMLAAQRLPADFTAPVVFDEDKGHDDWVAAVVAELRENLGCRVEARPMRRARYLQWLAEPDALFRATWMCDYPAVDNFLFPLFHSTSVGRGNYSGYRNATVDALIDRARATADVTDRRDRYEAAERAVCGDLPILPLWFGVHRYLINTDRFEFEGPPIDMLGDPSPRLFRART